MLLERAISLIKDMDFTGRTSNQINMLLGWYLLASHISNDNYEKGDWYIRIME